MPVMNRRLRVNLQSLVSFVCFIFLFIFVFLILFFFKFRFAGNELDSFPVDVSFMSSIRKRISLAKQIDKEEHKKVKMKKTKTKTEKYGIYLLGSPWGFLVVIFFLCFFA